MTSLVIKFLTVQPNPAETFAKLMSERRNELGITLDVLQERTGIKKQHLSTLERATPHSLTGKAVVPKRPTVEKIARGLDVPLETALEAAGYATSHTNVLKKPTNVMELFEALDALGLDVHFDGGMQNLKQLGEDDLQELLDSIVANASAKVKRLYTKTK